MDAGFGCAGTGGRRLRRFGAKLHVARQLATFFDDDLAVANGAFDLALGVDHEFVAHGQVAVKLAVYFSNINVGRAFERAVGHDLDDTGVHRRFDGALNHQGVAIGDFNAFEFDVGADYQAAAAF